MPRSRENPPARAVTRVNPHGDPANLAWISRPHRGAVDFIGREETRIAWNLALAAYVEVFDENKNDARGEHP
jgi:hypothetical protein